MLVGLVEAVILAVDLLVMDVFVLVEKNWMRVAAVELSVTKRGVDEGLVDQDMLGDLVEAAVYLMLLVVIVLV